MDDRDPAKTGLGPPSPWACLGLAASVCIFCPLASLAGPFLGWRALVDIRRNPERSGRRLAIAAIILGLATGVLWLGGGWWWNANVRHPILEGPLAAIAAAQAGDVGRARAGFHDDATPDALVSEFGDELTRRYGRVIGMRVDSGAVPRRLDGRAPIVPYLVTFERATIAAEARFAVLDERSRLALGFAWIAIRDPERGDLVYPPTADVPPRDAIAEDASHAG